MVQYYVNPVSGNNANTGTQESAPFKTIAHALQQVRTGDRIQLASGTYSAASGEQFPLRIINGVTVIGNEAQKGKGILIEGGGASYPSPLMEGSKPNVTIWLEDNNIQLLGITATNPNSKGIGVWVESPSQIAPTVKSCTFTGCGKDEKDKEGVGIAVVGGASPKISDNVIKLNKGCGLTVRSGIIASEIARPVLLNNVIEQNFQDGLLVSGQCQPILGTSAKPGGNLLRGNCGYDLQNSGTATLSLVGNQIDPARVQGKVIIENNTVPAPLPCPKDRVTLIKVVGERGELQPALQPGDALTFRVTGLRPSTLHSVTIQDDAGEVATQTILSDASGEIRDAVLWPQIGLDDPREQKRLPVEEVRNRWYGRTITLHVREGERAIGEARLTIAKTRKPLAVATDAEGRLLNGFEIGADHARLTLLDFVGWKDVRIWMVPRQHEWRDGDRITPVLLASQRAAQVDVSPEGDVHRIVVANSDELVPGAYDFVIRPIRYGYEDDDDLFLRSTDVVTNRRYTGLVVREKFMASKIIRGGCTNLQQIAGRRTLGNVWPYIQFSDTFQVGEDIWGALDPLALDPAHTGKGVAMYVVQHKTAAQWTADNSLSHLAVLGGNAAVQRWLTQSYCVNANLRLLWPNASQVGDYDIVADFGNNATDLTVFSPDDHYDMPLDIIDGYVVPGFRVVPDPAVDTSFANVGVLSYDETTQGYVDVVGDGGSWHVRLKASVHFPSTVPGATLPGQISAAQPNYPLVVVVHGNGADGGYLGYEYLLDHFAMNGFIAASIHLEPGQSGTDRARVLHRHLQILFPMFGTHIANNVGIMGHSRGGEAVVIATRLNQQEAWGYNINAVISLAPTNQYTFEHFGGAWARPYLVIYGSLDGDLGGISDTGFELYDNASDMKKSMMFVYRSCHDRYNTVWGDGDITSGWSSLAPTDVPRVLSVDAHHKIAMGYMTAFYRQYLRNETQWEGLFRGEWVPAAVQAADANMKIYPQYEDTTVRSVDNFEGPHSGTSWQTSTIGGAVTQTGLPATPQENDLRTMDPHSPHQTAGLLLSWDTLNDTLHYDVPAGQRDVHNFAAVSFRVSQRVDSASNPVNQVQDLRLTLTDGAGKSRAIRISKLTDIPYPDVRGYNSLTKSALRTVRVPLSVYAIKCLGVDAVDLTDIVSLTFEFDEKPAGEIEIDSLQFTN
jgi:hypothetical protein